MRIQNPGKVKNYYQALLNRDEAYVGIFYAGVITTGIFLYFILPCPKTQT